MNRSVIYRSLWFYRVAMSLLYGGRYRMRFQRVAELIRDADQAVLELCFGDVVIASYCRRLGKKWLGLDANETFVAHAVKSGFEARREDVALAGVLPGCDVCIMMGSLYHFQARLPDLFRRVKAASARWIISEPVRNWTNASNPLLRLLARKGTRAGLCEETFRFDEDSLIKALDELKVSVGFNYRVVSVSRDMIVEVVWLS